MGLSEGLWIFVLIFVSQMSINALFIHKSYSLLPEGEHLIAEVSQTGALIRSTLRSLFWASIVWWGYALLVRSRIVKVIYSGWGITFAIIMFAVEGFLLHRYGMVYGQSFIQVLAGTNPREASEYFEATFDWKLLFFLGLSVSVLIWAIIKYVSWAKGRVFGWSRLLFIGTILPVIVVLLYSTPRTYAKVKSSGQAYDLTIAPYDRLIWNTYGFLRESASISKAIERVIQLDLESKKIDPYVPLPPQEGLNIIIIVGETLRRDYMHCYGFPLANTPGIDSILATGDMVPYTDVVSPAPNTIESLTKVLTYQTNDLPGKWYDYPALPQALQKAGYWVEWTSNQESTGTFIQPLNTFAKLSNGYKYVNARSIDEEHDATKTNYDEDVLPHLQDVEKAKTNGKKGFVQVIHLMGSHPVYGKRFPREFARFTPDSLQTRRGKVEDKVVADYINSIYYNDYIVTQIINKYSNLNSIVFYFSDHGEIIYDDPRNPTYTDHGMLPQGVSVPFFVYLSPQIRNAYSELYKRIRDMKDRRIMLDLFSHSLTGLLGIQNKYSNPELDFFSDQYKQDRKRVIRSFNQELVL